MDDKAYATWSLGGKVRKGFQNEARPDASRTEAEGKLEQWQGGLRKLFELYVVRLAGAVRPERGILHRSGSSRAMECSLMGVGAGENEEQLHPNIGIMVLFFHMLPLSQNNPQRLLYTHLEPTRRDKYPVSQQLPPCGNVDKVTLGENHRDLPLITSFVIAMVMTMIRYHLLSSSSV